MVEANALKCPECGSDSLFRDGQRYLSNGESAQRWLCRKCGYRFSNNPYKNDRTSCRRQLCVLQEAKKLEHATEIKTVAGDVETTQKSIGRFVKFLSTLENDGTNEKSAKLYVAYLKRIERNGGNLLDSDSVKAAIAKKNWSTATKSLGGCIL